MGCVTGLMAQDETFALNRSVFHEVVLGKGFLSNWFGAVEMVEAAAP